MSVSNSNNDGVIGPIVAAGELEEALRQVRESESEMVQLVALTMKSNSRIQVPQARGFVYHEVKALGLSPKITKEWAGKILTRKRMNNRLVRPPLIWQPLPPQRPRKKSDWEMSTFVRDGRTFEADRYAPEKGLEVNGRQIHHSCSQAIHFISKVLRTKEGIHQFIVNYDTRPAVAAWGNYVITQREAAERRALGVTGRGATVT